MTKTNFTIGYDIFNEIQDVTVMILREKFEEYYELAYLLAENELCEDVEIYENIEAYNEAVYETMDNIITINRISTNGLLFRALLEFFNKDADHNLNGYKVAFYDNVRSVVFVFDEDYIYWVTGCGYDTISSDLLGGVADGTKKSEFLEWLNK